MNVSLFLMLLTLFSTITGICTEGVKKLLEDMNVKYPSNIIAILIAFVVGTLGTTSYYVLCSIPCTVVNVMCIFLMGIASAFGAMVGYDKIIQTIKQLDSSEK